MYANMDGSTMALHQRMNGLNSGHMSYRDLIDNQNQYRNVREVIDDTRQVSSLF